MCDELEGLLCLQVAPADIIIMPQSRVALAESLSDTLASLQTARSGLSNAWALRMSASQKAHFAALTLDPYVKCPGS